MADTVYGRLAEALSSDWAIRARKEQLPPPGDDWSIWLLLSGRGFGKTRAGSEWVKSLIVSGRARRVALVGATASDIRDIAIEGESGLLSVCADYDRPLYEPSKRRVTFKNGAICTAYSALLEDLSGKYSPTAWATKAVAAFKRHEADRIVAEANQGGAMVETTLRAVDRSVPVRLVHASRGKITRAEPVSALYEQHKIHHVGCFPELEDECCSFEPGSADSPDRLDALVWALTDLMLGGFMEVTSFHIPVIASRPRGNFDAPFVSMADGVSDNASMPPGGWPAGSPEVDPFAYLNWSPNK
jgi:phage terminase large subunit-like protein